MFLLSSIDSIFMPSLWYKGMKWSIIWICPQRCICNIRPAWVLRLSNLLTRSPSGPFWMNIISGKQYYNKDQSNKKIYGRTKSTGKVIFISSEFFKKIYDLILNGFIDREYSWYFAIKFGCSFLLGSSWFTIWQ